MGDQKRNRPVVALLTDFGTRDWFAACMRGAVLSVNPGAAVVDITHEIPSGDINAGAFVLHSCFSCFPAGTVFAAVVDPGVGSPRKPVAASAGGYFFTAPDNGILSYVLDRYTDSRVWALENNKYFRNIISSTFHGRDIFAPAAAWLSKGEKPEDMGSLLPDYKRFGLKMPVVTRNKIEGEVIYIDNFGNLITNISEKDLKSAKTTEPEIQIKSSTLQICGFYQEKKSGEPLAVINSCGLLEVAVNGESAKNFFKVCIGEKIRIKI